MERKFILKRAFALILGVALLMLLVGSCKKDDNTDSGAYVMSFKVDGKLVEFKVQASLVAAFGHADNVYNAVFTGYDPDSNISLQIFDGKEIVAATYTGYGLVGGSIVGAVIGYSDKSGTLYTQYAVNSDATITISEITSSTVRGTFSGKLRSNGKSDISITEGKFYVWRAN